MNTNKNCIAFFKKKGFPFQLKVINISLLMATLFNFQLLAQQTIESPDKKISFNLNQLNGNLQYSVSFNNHPIIETAALGIQVNDLVFGENAAIGKITTSQKNEAYDYRGVHSKAVNNYNGASINITSPTAAFVLEIRVFNDGVAFRYIIDKKDSSIITKEKTAFVLPVGSILWSQPNVKYYEGRYSNKLIDTVKVGDLMGPPVTIELPNHAAYAAITEGGLTDFGGMSLIVNGKRELKANLSGTTRKNGRVETPWRIIEIGKDLNTLVNCDIIANVSEGYDKKLFPQGYNTDWVKPGRSVWSWLAGRGPITLENMKRFTDFAAALGFEYNLVDEGWANWKDSVNHRDYWNMMKELVDYSAPKGVKIWVWKAYPNRRGIPGIKEPEQRKQFFAKCKELGIAGLKVDFFDSENQEIIDFYQAALKDAAEYHLMMDFHGANKPTGESRTWPNEMTREAIRGLENHAPWGQLNTVYPFTRYLAGPADFTPLHFGDRLGEVTWAHQVASMAVFTSPLLCLGADPESILDNPAKELIKSIPPTWDETIVLPQSKIGELALYARRKGNIWFVAAMNGVASAKTIDVDLSFLGKDVYNLYSMKDESGKQASAILENTAIKATSKLTISLNPNGGYVGRFSKK